MDPNEPWQSFYPNGQLISKGKYKNQTEHGPWEFYFPNGNKMVKINYINGKPNGIYEKYNSAGIIIEIKYHI